MDRELIGKGSGYEASAPEFLQREYLRLPVGVRQDPNRHAISEQQGPSPYEPPRVLVIGSVRDLTGGSASSGNKDANSQYYW